MARWASKKNGHSAEALFLGEQNHVISRAPVTVLIEPHSTNVNWGMQPMPLEWMQRTDVMQRWLNPSGPEMEDGPYNSSSRRCFTALDLLVAPVLDEPMILVSADA